MISELNKEFPVYGSLKKTLTLITWLLYSPLTVIRSSRKIAVPEKLKIEHVLKPSLRLSTIIHRKNPSRSTDEASFRAQFTDHGQSRISESPRKEIFLSVKWWWAIIFLTKLRFPPGCSILTILSQFCLVTSSNKPDLIRPKLEKRYFIPEWKGNNARPRKVW